MKLPKDWLSYYYIITFLLIAYLFINSIPTLQPTDWGWTSEKFEMTILVALMFGYFGNFIEVKRIQRQQQK